MSDPRVNGTTLDRGADRDTRERPCPHSWCVLTDGHDGPHVVVPRGPHKPPNYGPK